MKTKFSKESFFSRNFLAGVVGCIFSIFAIAYNHAPSSPYPGIVFSLMLFFSIFVLLQSVLFGKNDRCSGFGLAEIVLMMFLVINPASAKYFGFYATALIEILAIAIFINKDKSKKGIIVSILFSLILVAVSYVIFTYGLRIRCPRGKIITLI